MTWNDERWEDTNATSAAELVSKDKMRKFELERGDDVGGTDEA